MNAEQLRDECERRGIPVRLDGVITASGLAALLDVSLDCVRKWRERGQGPKHREGAAPWRNHHFTYSLTVVAAYLEFERNVTTAD
jgi:hypothetical protein